MQSSIDRFNYLGSKGASGAYQAIIASMPPHDVYIEAFLGSGAILRNKPAAQKTIAIDKDPFLLDQANYPGIELLCCDSREYIEAFDYASCGRVLIYADPPYLLSTRTSKARYKHDFKETDHIKLINILRSVPASVILSGYPSRLYDELLNDWRTFQFQVMTRGGPRTEQLWLNFPADAYHWSTFAGSNFTDRQRIKRKAKRWKNNYQKLPSAERMAVLSALLDVH